MVWLRVRFHWHDRAALHPLNMFIWKRVTTTMADMQKWQRREGRWSRENDTSESWSTKGHKVRCVISPTSLQSNQSTSHFITENLFPSRLPLYRQSCKYAKVITVPWFYFHQLSFKCSLALLFSTWAQFKAAKEAVVQQSCWFVTWNQNNELQEVREAAELGDNYLWVHPSVSVITLNSNHTHTSTDADSDMLTVQSLSAVWRLQVSSTYYQGGAETEI